MAAEQEIFRKREEEKERARREERRAEIQEEIERTGEGQMTSQSSGTLSPGDGQPSVACLGLREMEIPVSTDLVTYNIAKTNFGVKFGNNLDKTKITLKSSAHSEANVLGSGPTPHAEKEKENVVEETPQMATNTKKSPKKKLFVKETPAEHEHNITVDSDDEIWKNGEMLTDFTDQLTFRSDFARRLSLSNSVLMESRKKKNRTQSFREDPRYKNISERVVIIDKDLAAKRGRPYNASTSSQENTPKRAAQSDSLTKTPEEVESQQEGDPEDETGEEEVTENKTDEDGADKGFVTQKTKSARRREAKRLKDQQQKSLQSNVVNHPKPKPKRSSKPKRN